jgi:hypothetical protein
MSEEQNKEQGLVKQYLKFIDTNVLFKKPISCLHAIISLLFPVFVLGLFIQYRIFDSSGKYVVAAILILIILGFAGVFGALIWWHRRINRDDGIKFYPNFRRFIQTVGEWLGTFLAISVFGSVFILLIFLSDDYNLIAGILPFSTPGISIAMAFYGPIGGFIIIIITKIILFLLDPVIRLIVWIWGLIKRIVLYCYRVTISFFGNVERNTPFWIGATWVLAVGVIIATLVLCFIFGGIAMTVGLVAALAFMGYLIFKRKHDM